jgi:hypothetical protein
MSGPPWSGAASTKSALVVIDAQPEYFAAIGKVV